MPESNEQAWERIQRGKYLCCFCDDLFQRMKAAANRNGPTAAMFVLNNYDGMICGAIDAMKYPKETTGDDHALQPQIG